MRASDVATFGYAENWPAKQWQAFQIGFQRKQCKQHYSLVIGLEKVMFREGNCQGK